MKALLGQAFPVLPRFTVADPEPLRKSQAARTTLCAGDDLAPGAWLRRMGLVREGVDRFARVRGAAELLHSDVVPRDLAVLQLPHAAGDRWLALPFDRRPAPASSPSSRTPAAPSTSAPRSAGLFVDGVDRDHPRPRGDDRARVPPRRAGRPRSADHPARRPAGGDRPGLERRDPARHPHRGARSWPGSAGSAPTGSSGSAPCCRRSCFPTRRPPTRPPSRLKRLATSSTGEG